MKKIKLRFLTYVLVSVTRIVILMNNLKDCLCAKSLIYDSVVTCDEIVDMHETATIGSVNKRVLSSLYYFPINCMPVLLIFITIVFEDTTITDTMPNILISDWYSDEWIAKD